MTVILTKIYSQQSNINNNTIICQYSRHIYILYGILY